MIVHLLVERLVIQSIPAASRGVYPLPRIIVQERIALIDDQQRGPEQADFERCEETMERAQRGAERAQGPERGGLW